MQNVTGDKNNHINWTNETFFKATIFGIFFYHSQNKLTRKFSDKAWHSGRNLSNNSVTTFHIWKSISIVISSGVFFSCNVSKDIFTANDIHFNDIYFTNPLKINQYNENPSSLKIYFLYKGHLTTQSNYYLGGLEDLFRNLKVTRSET